jgi:hypothetical protein
MKIVEGKTEGKENQGVTFALPTKHRLTDMYSEGTAYNETQLDI